MSLQNAYYLFTGFTGENAIKINSKYAKSLGMMLNSEGIGRMNCKANENLDTDETRKIRDRYSKDCFNFVVEKMGDRFHVIDYDELSRRPISRHADNLDQYRKRTTAVTLHAPEGFWVRLPLHSILATLFLFTLFCHELLQEWSTTTSRLLYNSHSWCLC